MAFKGKLIAGLVAAAAALIVVAVLSYFSLGRNAEDRRWVEHTYIVLERLGNMQASMHEAETAERGYLLTGEEAHLAIYKKAVTEVNERERQVRELTADNARQQKALDGLGPLITAKLAAMNMQIRKRQEEGLAVVAEMVREGAGMRAMEEIRLAIEGMKGEEERLLVLRSAELDVSSQRTRILIVLGEVLGFSFLFAAGLVVYQEMKRRSLAEIEVRRLNADLEQRVADRTAELAERAKELERSNMELQQFAYVASHDPARAATDHIELHATAGEEVSRKARRQSARVHQFCGRRLQTLADLDQ